MWEPINGVWARWNRLVRVWVSRWFGVLHLPRARVGHRQPGLGRSQGVAGLQQLDRVAVGRLHEGHASIPRRAVDRDARVHQPLAGGVDVVHRVGEVPEEAPGCVGLGVVPVVRQLDLRRVTIRAGAQEQQREAALFGVVPTELDQAELGDEEVERSVEVAHAQHGVEVTHDDESVTTAAGNLLYTAQRMGTATAPSRAGELLGGRYRLGERLAVGGMGEVYRAVNETVSRPVAIKLLKRELADRPEAVRRFLREGRATNRVDHPNIVKVVDVDQDGDQLFIVQDLLEGEDLAKLLKRSGRRLAVGEVLDIIIPIADALGEAHAMGLVHRDLKPGNIFLAEQHGRRVPMILDFGIAKLLVDEDAEDDTPFATQAGVAMGTPAFMSPEQVMSPTAVDARSDVWALGVVLYRAISGELPFSKESPGSLMVAVCTESPRPIAEVVGGVPEVLIEVITGCLQRWPSDRFANGTAVSRALVGAREVIAEEISGSQVRPRAAAARRLPELELEIPVKKTTPAPRSSTRVRMSSSPPSSRPAPDSIASPDSIPAPISSIQEASSSLPPVSHRPAASLRAPALLGTSSVLSRAPEPLPPAAVGMELAKLGGAVAAALPVLMLGWSFRANDGIGRLGATTIWVLAAACIIAALWWWRMPTAGRLEQVGALGFAGTGLLAAIAGQAITSGTTPASWLARPGGATAALALGVLAVIAGQHAKRHFSASPVDLTACLAFGAGALLAGGAALRLVI
jgi:serine/threonine protein kinase